MIQYRNKEFLQPDPESENYISCSEFNMKWLPVNTCDVACSKKGCQNQKDLICIKDNAKTTTKNEPNMPTKKKATSMAVLCRTRTAAFFRRTFICISMMVTNHHALAFSTLTCVAKTQTHECRTDKKKMDLSHAKPNT